MQRISFNAEYAKKNSRLIQEKVSFIVLPVTIRFVPAAQTMRRSYGLKNDPINSCIYYSH